MRRFEQSAIGHLFVCLKNPDGPPLRASMIYLQTVSQKQQNPVLNTKSENKKSVYFKNLITTKTLDKLQICFILSKS